MSLLSDKYFHISMMCFSAALKFLGAKQDCKYSAFKTDFSALMWRGIGSLNCDEYRPNKSGYEVNVMGGRDESLQ